MAALQDTAEFQIVPSDSGLSGTHSRPRYDRDTSYPTVSYAVSSDFLAVTHVRSKTQAHVPLPVEESGRDSLSSSGAMSASLPTPSDVATSSTGDKHELGLSSARMKRRESRRSKNRGQAGDVNQKSSLGASAREGERVAHSAQEVGDVTLVGAGGEVAHEGAQNEDAREKRKVRKKRAASREKPTTPHLEEDVDGAQSHQQNIGKDTAIDHPLEQAERLIQPAIPPLPSSTPPLPSSTPPLPSSTPPLPSSTPPLPSVTLPPDDEPVLSVTIHHCTPLQPHSSLRHPLVKVHFVNTNTGEYLLKSDRKRRVVSYYETEHQGVDYVLPAATQPCNLKAQKKPYSPAWEETLVVNEAISSIVTPGTIAFFEVLDFVDFSSVSEWSAHVVAPVSGNYSGWFKVAWAFLQTHLFVTPINERSPEVRGQFKPVTIGF